MHVVEAGQGGQGLQAGAAGVVGDLVVVDVVDVDAPGATHHLLRDDRGVEVAQQAVGEGPQAGERPGAVHARVHGLAMLPLGLEPFAHELGDRARHAAREPVGPQQEPREDHAGAPRATAHLESAHRHRGLRRVPGEQVGDRHSVVGEQTPTVGRAGLDDRGVLGTVGHQHSAELPVVPAERRHATGMALQDGLLTGRCRARHLHGPFVDRMAAAVHPAAQGRHRAGLQDPLHHREGHAVELDEQDAVDLGVGHRARPGAQQRRRERLVGAGADEPGEQGAEGRCDPGCRDCGPERARTRRPAPTRVRRT